MEAFLGFILIIAGVIILIRGLNFKEDENTMDGLKFRMLLTGGASIFIGLIIMLR
jgi:hypothetical protein